MALEATPYYGKIRGGEHVAFCHDGEVHDILMISMDPRPGFLPIVRGNARPNADVGERVVRRYEELPTMIKLTYELEDYGSEVYG